MKIFDKITSHYQQKLPFVVYRKSNQIIISGFFQTTDELFTTEDFSENGFVFAPFNNKENAILLPKKKAEFISEEFISEKKLELNSSFFDDLAAKENHIKLVKKAISEIKNNQFKKVVISRKEEVQISDFDIILTIKKLLQEYKNAMVYVWFHPKVGLWLGATPETLLKVNKNKFETMALAGTQSFVDTKNVRWKTKEVEEQQLVTNYIVGNLKPLVHSLKISDAETIRAGNLLHLRTKISGELKNINLALISKLHPTPAVCGLPMQIAKQFVLKNEKYNRSFYTGFLGVIDTISSIFVNLRCMEIKEKKAIVYVGGGITKDSNPEKEWEETVAKTRVMKKVL